jgi:hypothetical protein
MIVVGGGWLVAIPGTILFVEQGQLWSEFCSVPFLILGSVTCFTGAVLALIAGNHLMTFGRGTPFPLDPTRCPGPRVRINSIL